MEERKFIYQTMDEISVRGINHKQLLVDIMRKMGIENVEDESLEEEEIEDSNGNSTTNE